VRVCGGVASCALDTAGIVRAFKSSATLVDPIVALCWPFWRSEVDWTQYALGQVAKPFHVFTSWLHSVTA